MLTTRGSRLGNGVAQPRLNVPSGTLVAPSGMPGPAGSGGGIGDAPIDGTLYGRQDGVWEPVPAGGPGGGINLVTGVLPVSVSTVAGNANVSLGLVPLNLGGTGVAAANAAAALSALGGAPVNNAALTGAPTAPTPLIADDSTAIATTAWVTGKIAGATAGVSQINVTAPITASAATGVVDLALGTSNTNVGTFQGITVNAQGLVTAAVAQGYLTGNQNITISGDVSGSGTTVINGTLATVNSNVGTFQGLTVNAKGLVTAAVDNGYATLASPALSGTPTAPTAVAGTSTTQLATTAFVQAELAGVAGEPAGNNLQLQYNNNGVFGGAGITLAPDTNSLTAPGPNGRFIVNRSGVAIDSVGTPAFGVSAFEAQGAGGEGTAIKMTVFNSLPVLHVRRAQGSPNTPAANPVNNNLFAIRASSYRGTYGTDGDWSGGNTGNAAILFITSEAQTLTAQGTRIDFVTTPTGSTVTTAQPSMTLRNGLVVGDPLGLAPNVPSTDLGRGTVHVSGGYYVNEVLIGGFSQSAGWVAGTNPDNAIILTNNTGHTLNIIGITGVVEVANGSAAQVNVYRGVPGLPLSSGTVINTSPFDTNANVGIPFNMGVTAGAALASGERLGLRVVGTPSWISSVATVTVYLQ